MRSARFTPSASRSVWPNSTLAASKKESKDFGLRLAISMVDLTTLEGKDTPGKIAALCQKALRPHPGLDCPSPAAVCVYPSMVRHAAKHLEGYSVRIASVATAFPSGQTALKTRSKPASQKFAKPSRMARMRSIWSSTAVHF